MKILYIDWPCFGRVDIQFALEQAGHEFIPFFHEGYQDRENDDFDLAFDQFFGTDQFDCCFSFNYFAAVSNACNRNGLKYISVTYDNPYVMLYSYSLINPCNYVFLFDKQEYLHFRKGGISNVYYRPLPANATIIDHLLTKPYDHQKLSADVSFVGALYNEDHNFFDRLGGLNDYTKGYLDAIMESQLKIQGYNFIEEVLTDDIIKELIRVCPYGTTKSGIETPSYIYANYFIDRKLTSIERQRLLTAAATVSDVRLYTLKKDFTLPGIENLGAVDYYSEMPYVFANSKINLNITLRSIKSGIPLRAMDIMAAGGFLLTNYQEDFLEYFVPGEDFVYFENEQDMKNKITYYLEHEEERIAIARNGHQKVKENHSFEKFFQEIFAIVFA